MEASGAVSGSAQATAYEQFDARVQPGVVAGTAALIVLAVGVAMIGGGAGGGTPAVTAIGVVVVIALAFALAGFVVVQPNESRVLILFGRYVGTVRQAGLWWVNPLTVIWRQTEKHVVDLDPERKAAMVSNLMVVLSGDHSATPVINSATPVINAGSLYT